MSISPLLATVPVEKKVKNEKKSGKDATNHPINKEKSIENPSSSSIKDNAMTSQPFQGTIYYPSSNRNENLKCFISSELFSHQIAICNPNDGKISLVFDDFILSDHGHKP